MNNQKVGIKERFFDAKSKEEVVALVQALKEFEQRNLGYGVRTTPSTKTIRYCQRIADKWGVE